MRPLRSYEVIFCFRFQYPLKLHILYFWTNSADSWLKERILAADSKFEAIFYIRGQYQANIGHFCNFPYEKAANTP